MPRSSCPWNIIKSRFFRCFRLLRAPPWLGGCKASSSSILELSSFYALLYVCCRRDHRDGTLWVALWDTFRFILKIPKWCLAKCFQFQPRNNYRPDKYFPLRLIRKVNSRRDKAKGIPYYQPLAWLSHKVFLPKHLNWFPFARSPAINLGLRIYSFLINN